MDVLWRAEGPLKVREVLEQLHTGRDLAYTTVMTVLDNLHRKDWVTLERDRRAYRYLTAASRAEVAANSLREVLDGSGDPEAVLLHFSMSVTDSESAVLRKALRRRTPHR